ncbi:uba/thif-type nad/fad binding protein, partial [Cladochytrium replicatum]
MCSLDRQTIERYSRQLLLPEVGCEGQERLLASSVVVVGAGGIGSSALLYLACAGICSEFVSGRIGIVDYDVVDRSNLQSQIIHSDELANPTCNVEVHDQVLDQTNALAILEKYNVGVDANASVILGKHLFQEAPSVWKDKWLTVHNHRDGPCYWCLFPDPPPVETVANCNEAGVLGVVPGIIGCYIALEVIKIVCGHQTASSEKMLLFDGLSGVGKVVKLKGKHPHCFACGEHQITELVDYVQFCGSPHNDQVCFAYNNFTLLYLASSLLILWRYI